MFTTSCATTSRELRIRDGLFSPNSLGFLVRWLTPWGCPLASKQSPSRRWSFSRNFSVFAVVSLSALHAVANGATARDAVNGTSPGERDDCAEASQRAAARVNEGTAQQVLPRRLIREEVGKEQPGSKREIDAGRTVCGSRFGDRFGRGGLPPPIRISAPQPRQVSLGIQDGAIPAYGAKAKADCPDPPPATRQVMSA